MAFSCISQFEEFFLNGSLVCMFPALGLGRSTSVGKFSTVPAVCRRHARAVVTECHVLSAHKVGSEGSVLQT